MTETTTAKCIMGASTDTPCPFPATEPVARWEDRTAYLCAFHAATEPLVGEQDEMGVCVSLVRAYLKGAGNHPAAAPLVDALERVEADFLARQERVGKVLEDLEAAEFKLMRS